MDDTLLRQDRQQRVAWHAGVKNESERTWNADLGKIYSDCAEEWESFRRRSAVPFRRLSKEFQSKVRRVARKHSVSSQNNQTLQDNNLLMFLSCPSTTIANSPRQSYLECFQKPRQIHYSMQTRLMARIKICWPIFLEIFFPLLVESGFLLECSSED